jgi:uncharacterized protein
MKYVYLLCWFNLYFILSCQGQQIQQKSASNCAKIMPITSSDSTVHNVLGTALQACCFAPQTGYYRDGFCHTGENDRGVHVVCAQVTLEFLEFSKSQGNNLMASSPTFPGLKPDDKWCLCASRWKDAYDAGVAPPIILESTHENALQYIGLDILEKMALPTENTGK